MTEASVIDWSATLKKGARSSDDHQVGTVVGTSGESVMIEWGSRQIYTVPKNDVQAFDGNEILLTLSKDQLESYASKV